MNYLKSILLFILLLVFVNFSLAYPDLILENKNPQPRENIYGYISDAQLLSNVLNKEDFYFYEGRAPIKPTEYNLIKYNEGYYFYLYFRNNFYDRIMKMTAKSSVDSVRMEMIADMLVPFPPTKAEQTAIANALKDADAYIQSLEKLIEKKRR